MAKRTRKTQPASENIEPTEFTPRSTVAVPVKVRGSVIQMKLERGRTYRVDPKSAAVDAYRGTIHPSTLKALRDESTAE